MSTSSKPEERALAAFTAAFGARPTAIGRAPARVELLGNHTDYNGGLVMAAAIDRQTVALARPAEGPRCSVVATGFDDAAVFGLDPVEPAGQGAWDNYVRGVVWALQQAAGGSFDAGFEMAIAGDVPLGAGLSSSASLQAAVAMALIAAGLVRGSSLERLEDDVQRMELAHILRRSENEFVGVASGLLDQFSSLFGRRDNALYLDCRSLDHARLPLGDPGPAIVVCDSKTSRRLADGMYNHRRAECESVVRFFQERHGADQVRLLRDVTLDELREHWDELDPVSRKRARHVLTENQRVERGASALRSGDLGEFGRLISASHASSRDDFENSSPALDALIEAAQSAPGFLGGKLSGAGWAGCTVNLVEARHAERFAQAVRIGYARRMGHPPELHVCLAADGAKGGRLSTPLAPELG